MIEKLHNPVNGKFLKLYFEYLPLTVIALDILSLIIFYRMANHAKKLCMLFGNIFRQVNYDPALSS